MPCMYDSWDLNYKFPFGAIRRRSDCNFTIYLPGWRNTRLSASYGIIPHWL